MTSPHDNDPATRAQPAGEGNGGGLFTRALIAFLVLPGTIAFAVPWFLLRRPGTTFEAPGVAPFVLGSVLLVWWAGRAAPRAARLRPKDRAAADGARP